MRTLSMLGLVVAILSANAAVADNKTVDVIGEGSTRSAAIVDGLNEAIRQVNGTRISHDRVIDRKVQDVMSDLTESFRHDFESENEFREQITSVSNGVVQGYEVLAASETAPGRWQVEMRVSVPVFSEVTSGRWGRRTIAVLPIEVGMTHPGLGIGFGKTADRVGNLVLDHLVQSRRFTVLDRSMTDAILDEQDRIASGDVVAAEMVKLGQALGTDYLMALKIEDIEFDPRSGVGRMRIREQIVDVATTKVHWSHIVDTRVQSESELGDRLLEKAASEVVEKTLDAIYPVKVVLNRGDNTIVLNRGGVGMEVDQHYNVYSIGEVIKDPDTGAMLGRDERLVATAKVFRVTPKLTYARVVNGDASMLEYGAVCRRTSIAPMPPEPVHTPNTTNHDSELPPEKKR